MTVLAESSVVLTKSSQSVQSETDTRSSQNASKSETKPRPLQSVLESKTTAQTVQHSHTGKQTTKGFDFFFSILFFVICFVPLFGHWIQESLYNWQWKKYLVLMFTVGSGSGSSAASIKAPPHRLAKRRRSARGKLMASWASCRHNTH